MERLGLVVTLGLVASCGASTQRPPVAPSVEVVEPTPSEPARSLVPQHALRSVDASAWDPVTRTRVIASTSGHVALVDGATGLVRAVQRFARHTAGVDLVVGAGRAMIVAGSEEEGRTIAPIVLATGEVLDFHTTGEASAVASMDGSTIAAWSADTGTIAIERVAPDEASSSCELAVPEDAAGPPLYDLSPDGKRFVVLVAGRVLVGDARECTTLRTFEGTEALALVVANDGQVAISSEPTSVSLYSASGDATQLTLREPWTDLRFTPDGRTLVGQTGTDMPAIDLATGAPSTLDAAARALAFERARDPNERTRETLGGERWIESVDVRPDAEGLLLDQSGTFVLVAAGTARVLTCLDPYQEIEWSVDERGVLRQGDGGVCNVETGTGRLPTPIDPDMVYVDSPADAQDVEPEVQCAPADPEVCVSYPPRGAVMLRAGRDARPRALPPEAREWGIQFSATARYVGVETQRATRIIEASTGRDALRTRARESIVDWSRDDRWVITSASPSTSRIYSLATTTVSFDVPHLLRPESVAFEPGGASAFACTSAGIERISLTDGTITPVVTTPCETLRLFGDRAVFRGAEPGLHLVELATGRVLLAIDDAVEWPSAGSPYFSRCEGSDRILFDVVRAVRTIAPNACGHVASAADGSYWVARVDGDRAVLSRPDGAHLALRVIWTGDAPHPFVEAADGAFWVGSDAEVVELNVVEATSDGTTVVSANEPEMRRRFYRPTLLADFFAGRPLPEASR